MCLNGFTYNFGRKKLNVSESVFSRNILIDSLFLQPLIHIHIFKTTLKARRELMFHICVKLQLLVPTVYVRRWTG